MLPEDSNHPISLSRSLLVSSIIIDLLFHFQLSRDCKYISTTTTLVAESETFTFVGDIVVDPGYTLVMPWQAIAKNKISPNFAVGDNVPIHSVSFFLFFIF